jgi:hypothetical protein
MEWTPCLGTFVTMVTRCVQELNKLRVVLYFLLLRLVLLVHRAGLLIIPSNPHTIFLKIN